MSTPELHHHSFQTMGAVVEMLLLGDRQRAARKAFAQAEALAADWMRIFNRFDATSEISCLNAMGYGQTSAVLFSATVQAAEAARISLEAFNPLTLPALIAAGYDRSFEHLERHGAPVMPADPAPSIDKLELDVERRWVGLPEGGQLDLNGIAKGLYADELARRLAHWRGGVVSAGGDMRVWGEGPDDGAWTIGVEPPDCGDEDIAAVTLERGGIATSGVNRRAWRSGDVLMHHLIDPVSGRPAAATPTTVTVIAPTATLAEVAATALCVNPGLAEHRPFSDRIWGALIADTHRCATCIDFDSEAPFHVYIEP